jgi:outer membrane lipoprotein carrier protein
MKVLLGSFAILLFAGSAAAESLDEVIDQVQKVYRLTQRFRAEFSQDITLRATKRPRKAGGRVFFEKPGKFRFVYTRGAEKKVIVSDGKKVWTYLTEDGQVRIDPFDQKLAASLRFLWGAGDLRTDFDIQKYEGTGFGRAGDHVIELIPKAHAGHYKKLVFVVDPKTFEVRETIIYDPVGNVNRMVFENVARNIAIKEATFRFNIPKGAQVIRSPELKENDG